MSPERPHGLSEIVENLSFEFYSCLEFDTRLTWTTWRERFLKGTEIPEQDARILGAFYHARWLDSKADKGKKTALDELMRATEAKMGQDGDFWTRYSEVLRRIGSDYNQS